MPTAMDCGRCAIIYLIDFMRIENNWEGRYSDLLAILLKKYPPRNRGLWPETPKSMAVTVKRYLSLLEVFKITVTEIEPRKETGIYINIQSNVQDNQEIQSSNIHLPACPVYAVHKNSHSESDILANGAAHEKAY